MEALGRLEKPWFFSMPNIYGVWGQGKRSPEDKEISWLVDAWKAVGMPDSDPTAELDSDIWFWHQMRRFGNNVYCTPEVRIGHGEETIRIYDENMDVRTITVQDWREMNKNGGALRTQRVDG
jgi:hypothetical protein